MSIYNFRSICYLHIFRSRELIFRKTVVITAGRNSPVGGRTYETVSTVAKPYSDETAYTIHVDIHYTVSVRTTVFLKINPKDRTM